MNLKHINLRLINDNNLIGPWKHAGISLQGWMCPTERAKDSVNHPQYSQPMRDFFLSSPIWTIIWLGLNFLFHLLFCLFILLSSQVPFSLNFFFPLYRSCLSSLSLLFFILRSYFLTVTQRFANKGGKNGTFHFLLCVLSPSPISPPIPLNQLWRYVMSNCFISQPFPTLFNCVCVSLYTEFGFLKIIETVALIFTALMSRL